MRQPSGLSLIDSSSRRIWLEISIFIAVIGCHTSVWLIVTVSPAPSHVRFLATCAHAYILPSPTIILPRSCCWGSCGALSDSNNTGSTWGRMFPLKPLSVSCCRLYLFFSMLSLHVLSCVDLTRTWITTVHCFLVRFSVHLLANMSLGRPPKRSSHHPYQRPAKKRLTSASGKDHTTW